MYTHGVHVLAHEWIYTVITITSATNLLVLPISAYSLTKPYIGCFLEITDINKNTSESNHDYPRCQDNILWRGMSTPICPIKTIVKNRVIWAWCNDDVSQFNDYHFSSSTHLSINNHKTHIPLFTTSNAGRWWVLRCQSEKHMQTKITQTAELPVKYDTLMLARFHPNVKREIQNAADIALSVAGFEFSK